MLLIEVDSSVFSKEIEHIKIPVFEGTFSLGENEIKEGLGALFLTFYVTQSQHHRPVCGRRRVSRSVAEN